tara:strand:+ start:791 stop:1441 length:651 start_codon:yes stop_codon:yes gene_type:complete
MALSKVNFNSLNVTPSASKVLKFNSSNNGLEAGDVGGSLNLISTSTASSSSTIDITSGIDSTYKEYIVKFINIHPATDSVHFLFQGDTGTNTNYNQTITSACIRAYNYEGSGTPALQYYTSGDLAQGTDFHYMTGNAGVGNDSDQSFNGTLHLFNPSDTTFVKHFLIDTHSHGPSNYTMRFLVGGYFNTTSAITRLRFKFSSGNIDSGTIKLYGVS